MKGCCLATGKTFGDEGILNNRKDVFVYITDNELIEFSVFRSKGVIVSMECYPNKEERIACYDNMKFLFDAPEFEGLFKTNASIDEVYMQCQIAQHCLWNQDQEKAKYSPNV